MEHTLETGRSASELEARGHWGAFFPDLAREGKEMREQAGR